MGLQVSGPPYLRIEALILSDLEKINEISSAEPHIKAKAYVLWYIVDRLKLGEEVTEDNIKVVWFCKTLQNWKAMVADIRKDGMFFEVSYNGDKKETYLDVYKKVENMRIPD